MINFKEENKENTTGILNTLLIFWEIEEYLLMEILVFCEF